MKISKPKRIIELNEWLPSYGETSVALKTQGLQLVLSVTYDGEREEQVKQIEFDGVSSFFVSSVPGVDLLKCTYEEIDISGSLIEFENSEAAKMWQVSVKRPIRHYQIFFLAENKRIEVFAEEVRLIESVPRA